MKLLHRIVAELRRFMGEDAVTRSVYHGNRATWARISSFATPDSFADNAAHGQSHHVQVSVFSGELDPEEEYAEAVRAALHALGGTLEHEELLPDDAPNTLHYMTQWTFYEEG